jgi:DNA repair photolyase
VLIAPALPGFSDRPEQVRAVVKACQQAGAAWIAASYLHLRGPLREHFMRWLAAEEPGLVESYVDLYRRSYVSSAMSHQLSAVVAEVRPPRRRSTKTSTLRSPPVPERPVPAPAQGELPLS